MVPEKDLERVLKPVIQRIHHDEGKVRKNLRPALTALAKVLCHPDFALEMVWEESKISAQYSGEVAEDLAETLRHYATWRRMEATALLILDEALWPKYIKDIVPDAGFLVYKTFGKSFTKWSGQTPSEFRKNPNPKILAHLERLQRDAERAESVESAESPERPESAELKIVAQRTLLEKVYRDAATTNGQQWLLAARSQLSTGRFEDASVLFGRVLDVAEETQRQDLAAPAHSYLGFLAHRQAALCVEHNDVDVGFDKLVEAEAHYLAADPLCERVKIYRNELVLPHDPRAPLLNSLCPRCRTSLLSQRGNEVRDGLDQALSAVRRDLPWFVDACDDCYYVVWQAFVVARLGQLDNAWRAFWLAHLADPFVADTPQTLGRFVALLRCSEQITFDDQSQRAQFAAQAVDVAVELEDPVREALARIYLGNAYRAMGEHDKADAEFLKAEKVAQDLPWLRAWWCYTRGALRAQQSQLEDALKNFKEAFKLYRDLDAHTAGLLCLNEGELLYSQHRYDEALEALLASEPLLDGRRAPLMLLAVLPLNLAGAFLALGQWKLADKALARCDYDRVEHRGLWAMERLNQACLALESRSNDALLLFAEAKRLCEELGRWLDVAVVALYTVEAYTAASEPLAAIESCAEALCTFRKVGCDHKTEEALARLDELLAPVTVDLPAIVGCVRQLALRHGGHLPVSSSDTRG